MKNTEPYTKISKSLAESLEKLYKTGGLALVFVFIGLLLSVFSFTYQEGRLSVPTFILGSLLILISFLLFLFTHFKGTVKTKETLERSANTLDALQKISLDLVYFTQDVRAYSLKNIDTISSIVKTYLPIIRPLLGKKGQEIINKLDNVSFEINDITTKTEQVLNDLEKALKENDYKVLKSYKKDIVNLNKQMKKALIN